MSTGEKVEGISPTFAVAESACICCRMSNGRSPCDASFQTAGGMVRMFHVLPSASGLQRPARLDRVDIGAGTAIK